MVIETTSKSQEIENENEGATSSDSSKYIHRWDTNETKYLLDQYRIYLPQIGPFRAFKNKTAMFEQIRKDLFTKFGIRVTGQQCLNRYKNIKKQNRNIWLENKRSGNSPTKMPYADEIEGIKNIDDSLEPEVLFGVNHVKINAKMKSDIETTSSDTCDISDTERQETPRKRLKSNSLEQVLRDISATAKGNRDRRYKEKCDLLISLLGKPTQHSE